MNVATGICQVLHLALDDLVQIRSVDTTLQRLSEDKQRTLDDLMERNSEGKLTAKDRKTFEMLVKEAEGITLANARLLAREKRRLSK